MSTLLQQLKVPFLTVLFTLLSFFACVKFFGPIPFTVNSITTTKSDLFTVDGVGEAKGVPSSAHISLGITKTAKTTEEAKNEANKVINEITQKLKSLGVADRDIKTSNFSAYPDRQVMPIEPNGGTKPGASDFTVTENLDITFDSVEKANQGLDIATAVGANSIGGVQFILDDSKKAELEQQARIEAIKNAKGKAQKIASAAGIRLGRVINVSENTGGYPLPFEAKAMSADNGASVPTQLNPGQNTIQIHISLSFETL